MNIHLRGLTLVLLAPFGANAGERCFLVKDSPVTTIEGMSNINIDLPSIIALTEEKAIGFIPEAKEKRVKWVGDYHDYFAEANWIEKDLNVHVDWGNGFGGASFDLAPRGQDLVGTVTPYADVRDSTYHPLVRPVELIRTECPEHLSSNSFKPSPHQGGGLVQAFGFP